MAFGLTRTELVEWKKRVTSGKIAIITHYWQDSRFPNATSVTKVGCSDLQRLINWGKKYGLKAEWIDMRGDYPHFDLFGEKQIEILLKENQLEQIKKYK